MSKEKERGEEDRWKMEKWSGGEKENRGKRGRKKGIEREGRKIEERDSYCVSSSFTVSLLSYSCSSLQSSLNIEFN